MNWLGLSFPKSFSDASIPILAAFTATLAVSALAELSSAAHASEPDWSSTVVIPANGRSNPYQWDQKNLTEKVKKGQLHALQYPVDVTGILLPSRPVMKALSAKPGDPLFAFLKTLLSLKTDFEDFNGFWDWLGLTDYPSAEAQQNLDPAEQIPYPNGEKPLYPMGVSLVNRTYGHHSVEGFTLSCAACHSTSLFGKPILGMTTRFPRSNLFFEYGQTALRKVSPSVFASLMGANAAEKSMYQESRDRIQAVGLKRPNATGLDTSLAQVALSLAKRAQTPNAERSAYDQTHPRHNLLDEFSADSKPAVWWNLKYKTRWLSDGSVASGNPVFTNFLWNEIGRGADIQALDEWLTKNSNAVEELTTAVFATQAPKWKNFISESAIHIERAKRGEILFAQNCARCHGSYEKAWNLSPSEFAQLKARRPDSSLIDTTKINYFSTTPVMDVGTDLNRRVGMRALAESLNPLAFSQKNHIVIEQQAGYVPPPLEGIWARYPFLHNNSVPNLCALMTPPALRPVIYYSGKAVNAEIDFDQACVGYPIGEKTPIAWKKTTDALFDSRRSGLGNAGHYFGIFTNPSGSERYTPDQKIELIEYLKTL